jgi:hypothetical protein
MEKGRVITGARCRFLLAGKKVGYATGVNGGEELQYDELIVLDNIQVEEHVPIGYRATLSATLVRIFGETVKSAGYFPKLGTSPEAHLKNILTQGLLSAVLIDTKNNKAFETYEQVKMSTKNFTINARGMVGLDIGFVCIRSSDESGG